MSLPIFFTGPILLLDLRVHARLAARTSPTRPLTQDPAQWLKSMILPWIALAFLFAALYARLTRATCSRRWARTTSAPRGPRACARTVVVKHGLRAALTPIVTIFGIDFGTLIGTTVITETVFNLRGLGYLSIQAIQQQDLPGHPGRHHRRGVRRSWSRTSWSTSLYAFIDPRVATAEPDRDPKGTS